MKDMGRGLSPIERGRAFFVEDANVMDEGVFSKTKQNYHVQY